MKHRYIFLLFVSIFLMPSITNAQISGTVYQELPVSGSTLNTYGVKDGNEPGIAGVSVTITDASGTISTQTTANDGTWSDPVTNFPVRVEFTWPLHSWLDSSPDGTNSGTSVQFLSAASSAVDFGLHYPQDFSSSANPLVVVNRHENGAAVSNSDAAVYSFLYNENGTYGDPLTGPDWTGFQDADFDEIGATYGLAYQRVEKRLFVSSLLKRHSGLRDGLGYVYVLDYSSNPATVSSSFDLQGVSGIDFGSIDRTTDSDLS